MKKIVWCIFGAGVFLLAIVILYANTKILRYTKNIVTLDSVPTSTYALVFGGGMLSKTQMTPMQTDRIAKGVELYKKGKAEKLFITGDDGGMKDDEVDAMHDFAVQNGVPTNDIRIDRHGYRTYESCYREKSVFGLTSTIAVSQTFHLSRIAYLCGGMGITVYPVAADVHSYGGQTIMSGLREVLARVKAVLQLEYTKPLPRTLEK